MTQDASLGKIDPKIRWPRRRPHGDDHSEWRSRRNRSSRTSVPAEHEAECRKAIAAFLDEQNRLDTAAD